MSPRLPDLLLVTLTDERLAALAEGGHERAFAVLVERHRPSLKRVAVRLVGTDHAEDVVQQTLLQAWSAIRAGTAVSHVRGWLHQILRNTAFNEHARNRPHDELPAEWGEGPGPSTVLESRLMLAAALGEMERLPDHQRAALVQTEFGGRSRHEIAADLGVSEGAVRQLVHRARNTLRTAVAALIPFPLVARTARSHPGSPLSHRVAQLGGHRGPGVQGAAGGTLLGGGAMKAGMAVLAVGALGGGLVVRAAVPPVVDRPGAAHVRGGGTVHTASVRAISDLTSPVRVRALSSSGVSVSLTIPSGHRLSAVGSARPGDQPRSDTPRSSTAAGGSRGGTGSSSDPVSGQAAANSESPQVESGGSSSGPSMAGAADSSSSGSGADTSSSGSDPLTSGSSADSSSSGSTAAPSSSEGAAAPPLSSSPGPAGPGPSAEQPVVAPGASMPSPIDSNPADASSSSVDTPGG